jgi:hypothetical protein
MSSSTYETGLHVAVQGIISWFAHNFCSTDSRESLTLIFFPHTFLINKLLNPCSAVLYFGTGSGFLLASVYRPSENTIAALFCALVYHTQKETMLPPSGYEQLGCRHDKHVGLYGEWFSQLSKTGKIEKIFLVFRGTVFSAPGDNTTFPDQRLDDCYSNDFLATVKANIRIVFGRPCYYLSSAKHMYRSVRDQYPEVPIIITGQSLGGAAAGYVTTEALLAGDKNVRGVTFNPLHYSVKLADETQLLMRQYITNFYVKNDWLTQNALLKFLTSTRERKPVGRKRMLAAAPDVSGSFLMRKLNPHFPEAALREMLKANVPPPFFKHVKEWLTACYPDETRRPPIIQAMFDHATWPSDAEIEKQKREPLGTRARSRALQLSTLFRPLLFAR